MTEPAAGLIGCGVMGRRHAAALMALEKEGRLRFAGIYDPRPEGYEALKREAPGAPPFFDDLEAFYAAIRPETLAIATTAPHHLPHLEAAAAHGVKRALVEKPLAVSTVEVRRIVALDAAGLRIAVNHQWPFFPAYARLKDLANGPALGGVVSASVMGGAFGAAMGGSHAIFLFEWMSGARLARASAWFDAEPLPNPRGAEFVDRAGEMRFEAEDGRALHVNCRAEQRHGQLEVWNCRLGQIVVDRLTWTALIRHRREEDREAPATRYGMPGVSESLTLDAMDLVAASGDHMAALIEGAGYVGAADGARVVELLSAAHLSAERGGAPVAAPLGEADAARSFPWC